MVVRVVRVVKVFQVVPVVQAVQVVQVVSLDDMHSENIWFTLSKPLNSLEKFWDVVSETELWEYDSILQKAK